MQSHASALGAMETRLHFNGFTQSLILFMLACSPALAQSWTLSGAPSNLWSSVACSADGSKLLAATGIYPGYGRIYISGDGGATWMVTPAPVYSWSSVVSSADGAKMAASIQFGGIYTSTNSGATWALSGAPMGYWQSLTCSADGSTLASADTTDKFAFSTDFGSAWNSRVPPFADVLRVVCSADGIGLVTANMQGYIASSTNAGTNWSTVSSVGGGVHSFAASANLNNLKAVVSSLDSRAWIVSSTNMGLTWITNNLPITHWTGVASSADGTRCLAVATIGWIYSSSDAGVTWVSNNAPAYHWQAVATTADGETSFAAASNGGIWVRRNTPAPVLRTTLYGNSLGLRWIVPSERFELEQTSTLAPLSWTEVTNSPTLNFSNLNNEVYLPALGTNTFYRLAMP